MMVVCKKMAFNSETLIVSGGVEMHDVGKQKRRELLFLPFFVVLAFS